jgi:hypothetical protein
VNHLTHAQISPFRFFLQPCDIRPHLKEFGKKNLSHIGILNQWLSCRETGAKAGLVGVVGETDHHSAEGRTEKVANGFGLNPIDEVYGMEDLPFHSWAKKW